MTCYIPIIDNGMGLSRTSWATSWIGALIGGALNGVKAMFEHVSYPYPDGVMNVVTHNFLQSGADKMVIIDTDVVFTPNDLTNLIGHNDVAIYVGLVPRRAPGLVFSLEVIPETNPLSDDALEVVEVVAGCRGFMMIHKGVFLDLERRTSLATYILPDDGIARRVFWTPLPGGHSEDFSLCYKWRQIGGRVYLDRRCRVRHAGNAIYPIKGTYDESVC